MSRHCRACGKFIYCQVSQNLFEQPDSVMLHQIDALTGLFLLQQPDMPSHICGPCEVALHEAIRYRERIIKTQKLLQSCVSVAEALNQIYLEDLTELDMHGSIVKDEDTNEVEELETIVYDVDVLELQEQPVDTHEIHIERVETESPSVQIDECEINQLKSKALNAQPKSISNMKKPDLQQKSQRHTSSVYASLSFGDNTTQMRRVNWSTLTEDEIVALKRERRKRDCICEQCGRHFSCPSNFKVHLLRHTGVKNYPCKSCNLKFYTAHLLRRHEMLHVCDRPFPCQYCGQAFNHYSGRIQHERNRHTNFKPYKCTECDKCFAVSGKLKTHMLCHTGVRDFHCEVCGQSFMRKSHLAAHFRSKGHKQNIENSASRPTEIECQLIAQS